VLRRSEAEIIGKNWFDVAVPERQREIFRITYAMLVKGDTQAVEYFENSIVTKDGEERIVAWRITVVRDAADQIVGTLRSGEDITDRKQAGRRVGSGARGCLSPAGLAARSSGPVPVGGPLLPGGVAA
jgi:PAS domain S-box-containing protein